LSKVDARCNYNAFLARIFNYTISTLIMKTAKEFYTHLDSIKATVWDQLADMADKIAQTEVFCVAYEAVIENGIKTPGYRDEEPVILEFIELFYHLDLNVNFDWMGSREHKLLSEVDYDFNQLGVFDLCKVLTVIVRNDRFYGGYLINRFEDGTILRILQALLNRQDWATGGE